MSWSEHKATGRVRVQPIQLWWNRPLLKAWAFECERATTQSVFHAVLLGVGLIALVTTATLTIGRIDQVGEWVGLRSYDWWLVCAGLSSWGAIGITCMIARLLRGERRRFRLGLELLVVGVTIFVLLVFGTCFISSVLFGRGFSAFDASGAFLSNTMLIPILGILIGFMWARLLIWGFAESFVPRQPGVCGSCGFDLRFIRGDTCVECGVPIPDR